MKAYSYEFKKHNIFQSMSRKGIFLDNSPMENFFSILKQEMCYGRIFKSYNELKTAIESVYLLLQQRTNERAFESVKPTNLSMFKIT